MVRDRSIIVCDLSNGDIAGDLKLRLGSQTTPMSTFCVAFHIFVGLAGEHRDFTLGEQIPAYGQQCHRKGRGYVT